MTKTPAQLRDHYIRLAKKAEMNADQRKNTIRASVTAHLLAQFGERKVALMGEKQWQDEIATVIGQRLSSDSLFRGHVSDNQWYIQQAIMHGTSATEYAIRDLINELRRNDRHN